MTHKPLNLLCTYNAKVDELIRKKDVLAKEREINANARDFRWSLLTLANVVDFTVQGDYRNKGILDTLSSFM